MDRKDQSSDYRAPQRALPRPRCKRQNPAQNREHQSSIEAMNQYVYEMVAEGLIAMSDVEVIKYVHQEGRRSQP